MFAVIINYDSKYVGGRCCFFVTKKIHGLVSDKKQFREDMLDEKLFGKEYGYFLFLTQTSFLNGEEILPFDEFVKVVTSTKFYILRFTDDGSWGCLFGPSKYYKNASYFLGDAEDILKGSAEAYVMPSSIDIQKLGTIHIVVGSAFKGQEHIKFQNEIQDSRWASIEEIETLSKDEKNDVSLTLLNSWITSLKNSKTK